MYFDHFIYKIAQVVLFVENIVMFYTLRVFYFGENYRKKNIVMLQYDQNDFTRSHVHANVSNLIVKFDRMVKVVLTPKLDNQSCSF